MSRLEGVHAISASFGSPTVVACLLTMGASSPLCVFHRQAREDLGQRSLESGSALLEDLVLEARQCVIEGASYALGLSELACTSRKQANHYV